MKLTQTSSLRSVLGVVTGLVSGFVAGVPIAVGAADLLPIVSIGSPFQNQTVGGSVMVSATSDSPGLVGLQFKIDNQNLGSEITSGSCRAPWDSTKAADGLHTITAAGRDQYGNVTLTQPVTVLVSNPPIAAPLPSPSPTPTPTPAPEPTSPTPAPSPTQLSIREPVIGATVSGSAVPIVATFPIGSRSLSYFLRDRATGTVRWSATGPNLALSATSSSFTADFSNVPPGSYNLVVVCQRLSGALAMDASITVASTSIRR